MIVIKNLFKAKIKVILAGLLVISLAAVGFVVLTGEAKEQNKNPEVLSQLGIENSALVDGLVGYWKMDEASWNGTAGEVVDSGPNNLNGRAGNGTYISTGKYGNAGTYDGSNDYVEIPNNSALNMTTGYTIMAWVNISNLGGSPEHHVINRYRWSSNAGYGMLVNSDGSIRCDFNGSAGYYNSGTVYVSAGVWKHIGCMYDGSSLSIIVDGEVKQSTGRSGLNNYSTNLYLGGPADAIGDSRFMLTGKIDEVRVYNRPLNSSELNYLYYYGDNSTGENGLMGYWKMDETGWNSTSGEVKDSSGNSINGTAYNGAYITSSGKYDNAGMFDGGNDFVAMPQTNLGSKFSISTWIKPNAKTNSGLLTNTSSGATTNGIKLYLNTWNSTDGKIIFETGNGSGGSTTSTPTGVLQWGVWQHIVVVVDVTTNSAKIYHNGVDRTASNGVISGVNTNQPWRVGSFMNNAFYYSGGVDELKFYNYKLTDQEIVAVYESKTTIVNMGDIVGGSEVVGGDRNNLEKHFSFDRKTGTTVINSVSTSSNASMVNMSAEENSDRGKIGNAYKFNGTDEYIDAGLHEINDTVYSISYWARGASSGNVLNRGDSGSCAYNPRVSLLLVQESGCGGINVYSIGDYRDNKWHHFVVVRNNTNFKAYVDGILKVNVTLAATSYGPLEGDRFLVGGLIANGVPSANFDGSIDDIRIFDYVLSAREVAMEFNDGAPVAWWKIDRGSGTTVYDYSGSNHHGTMYNMDAGTDWLVSSNCKLNKCMDFDGGNDYVMSSAPVFPSGSTNYYSLSLWVYPRTNAYGVVLSDRGTGNWSYKYQVAIGSNGTSASVVACANDSCMTGVGIHGSVTPNQWNHIVGVFDNVSNNIKIYINGKYVNQITGSFDSTNYSNTTIGAWRSPQGLKEPFSGRVDEVKIFNYLLTADDIKREYNLGASLRFN